MGNHVTAEIKGQFKQVIDYGSRPTSKTKNEWVENRELDNIVRNLQNRNMTGAVLNKFGKLGAIEDFTVRYDGNRAVILASVTRTKWGQKKTQKEVVAVINDINDTVNARSQLQGVTKLGTILEEENAIGMAEQREPYREDMKGYLER